MGPSTQGVAAPTVASSTFIKEPLRPSGRRERAYRLMWISLVSERCAQVFVQTLPTSGPTRTSARRSLLGCNLVFSDLNRPGGIASPGDPTLSVGSTRTSMRSAPCGSRWYRCGTVCVRGQRSSSAASTQRDSSKTAGSLHVSDQWWDSNPRANPHTLHDAYSGLGDCHGPRGHLTRSSSDPHGLQLVRP